MPRYSRRFRKKRKTLRKKLTLRKVNKKVNALANKIETKWIDGHMVYNDVDTTGSEKSLELNNIVEGTAANERVGQKITVKSITIKGQMIVGVGVVAPDLYNQLRLILIKYKTHGASTPAITDILQFGSAATYTNEVRMNSLYKKRSQYTFKILYDKVHHLGYQLGPHIHTSGTMYNNEKPKRFAIHVKCDDTLEYTDSGHMTGWSYQLMFFSDSGAMNYPQISYVSRVNFQDA